MQEKKMINELSELRTINLDRASEVMLKIVENNEDVSKFKGIYNVTKERLANVVSKNYQIIQHDDVVTSVVESLDRLNMKAKGRISFIKDTIDIRLVFKDRADLVIKDDTDEGIMLGMRILNSYDKSSSFRMEMFGIRMFCNNGMVLGKAMNDVKSITVHLGEEKTKDIISKKVEVFVSEMINSSERLQHYVSQCMEDSIEWEKATELINLIINTEKHRKGFFEELGELNRPVSRWEIYNALTSYATHNEQLTPYVENNIQTIAQRVLTNSCEKLMVVEQ